MSNIDFNTKKEFIYKAIEDATNTLRFIDTKVGAILVAAGLVTSLFVNFGSNIYKIYSYYKNIPLHSSIIGLSVIAYFVFLSLSLYYGFRTLKAANNPMHNVNNDGYNGTNLWYLLNASDNKISISVNRYNDDLDSIEEDSFIKMLSLELMKVSAIRNIKIKNVNSTFLWFKLSLAPIFIIIAYILFHHSIYLI